MGIIEKIKRLRGALSEAQGDEAKTIRAVMAGVTAFHLGRGYETARERYEKYCKGCAFNVQEPIPDLRVEDKEIPEISGRQCSHCGGCVLSYKLRQSVQKCEYWK